MRHLRIVVLAIITLAIFAGAADAQKRSVKKPNAKKPPANKTVPPLDVRAAREKVDVQLANVTRFVDVLGPIAQSIEDLDASAKTKRLPKATLDQNEANKQKVIIAIRNLRDALTTLESEFRTKPLLAKYLPSIEGISGLGSRSEDSAIAGRFVAAKDPLRDAAQKLTDTLAVLPR
ncbi:MAG TPA: hypothetical protein PLP07_07280 [Pyrinomonadaceae bacterium]|nr:hypothetical protein [Chloracidobacterium sp.]MBP9935344.1 hypothetical protein [Pyrinomonadaceae bacterium]MBK7803508.1 hypothetical protein [Chloracidobacterium sp.]MBK9438754.1 hypothetical protein [Chloracidobacterium sp.]MBL0241281.1 hypothetical protein [Chloracidobacterium sp.]